jgi:RNA polymerase sigma factor (sigma-70 family)
MRRDDPAQEALDQRLKGLMVASQGGDRVAYAELLRSCDPLVRRAGRRVGVSDDRLNDVVQETLLTIHSARQTYDPSRSFMAWVTIIAQRRAIDVLRRTGRSERREVNAPLAYEAYADADADSSEGWQSTQRSKTLKEAIARLPSGQREAVERLALGEQSLAEASAETGRTTGSLKVNLHRAIKALRVHLGSGGVE